MKFSRAIRDLNFDEKEVMLVSALTLFSSGMNARYHNHDTSFYILRFISDEIFDC